MIERCRTKTWVLLIIIAMVLGGCGTAVKGSLNESVPSPSATISVLNTVPAAAEEEILAVKAIGAAYALDPGLNGGATYLALSPELPTNLQPYQAAIFQKLSEEYQLPVKEGTYETLSKEEGEDSPIKSLSGLLFTLESCILDGETAVVKLEKYRGPLGAIWVTCTFQRKQGIFQLTNATIDAIS